MKKLLIIILLILPLPVFAVDLYWNMGSMTDTFATDPRDNFKPYVAVNVSLGSLIIQFPEVAHLQVEAAAGDLQFTMPLISANKDLANLYVSIVPITVSLPLIHNDNGTIMSLFGTFKYQFNDKQVHPYGQCGLSFLGYFPGKSNPYYMTGIKFLLGIDSDLHLFAGVSFENLALFFALFSR